MHLSNQYLPLLSLLLGIYRRVHDAVVGKIGVVTAVTHRVSTPHSNLAILYVLLYILGVYLMQKNEGCGYHLMGQSQQNTRNSNTATLLLVFCDSVGVFHSSVICLVHLC